MDAFAALDDPVRRRVLKQLRDGPQRVVDLARDHPVSRPAISRHLRHLHEAGLVQVAEQGRERHYSLRTEGLEPVDALLRELRPETPVVTDHHLDALETEVRRTTRERRASPVPAREESA